MMTGSGGIGRQYGSDAPWPTVRWSSMRIQAPWTSSPIQRKRLLFDPQLCEVKEIINILAQFQKILMRRSEMSSAVRSGGPLFP